MLSNLIRAINRFNAKTADVKKEMDKFRKKTGLQKTLTAAIKRIDKESKK